VKYAQEMTQVGVITLGAVNYYLSNHYLSMLQALPFFLFFLFLSSANQVIQMDDTVYCVSGRVDNGFAASCQCFKHSFSSSFPLVPFLILPGDGDG
jgi:hypothetical protein